MRRPTTLNQYLPAAAARLVSAALTNTLDPARVPALVIG
ncbi:hypothetical protein F504_3063 [Ralstonia pseudosolanacearum FQY_4]|nr:hypothetical protein F504_3063 [Ralstonia pseudosolanacearum FQY_4]